MAHRFFAGLLFLLVGASCSWELAAPWEAYPVNWAWMCLIIRLVPAFRKVPGIKCTIRMRSGLVNYDLWLAYYTNVDVSTSAPPPSGSYPNPTGVFNNWCFWQYSSTGASGGISPLDLDVCHNEYKPLSSFITPMPSTNFV